MHELERAACSLTGLAARVSWEMPFVLEVQEAPLTLMALWTSELLKFLLFHTHCLAFLTFTGYWSLSLFIFFCQGGICCPTMAGNTSHWSFGTPPLSLERSQLPSLIPTLWLSCLFLDEPTALAPTPLASTPTSACYMRRHVFFLLLVSFMSFVPKLPQ